MDKDMIRFYEELASNAHVALDTVLYDGWVLRFSEGYTGRANSVSILYPSRTGDYGKDISAKTEYCEKLYAQKGLPCIFKVTDADTELAGVLRAKGYNPEKPTDVMVCGLADKVSAYRDLSGTDCVFCDKPDEWTEPYFEFEQLRDEHKQDVFRRMLSKVFADTIYCTLMYEGKPAACASAAIERGYMLVQNVVVSPSLRGRGLGKKICASLLLKAAQSGIHNAYLQVMQDNAAAQAIYKKIGFEKIYSYSYMKK